MLFTHNLWLWVISMLSCCIGQPKIDLYMIWRIPSLLVSSHMIYLLSGVN